MNSIFLNDKDITGFQSERFIQTEELNTIETFDFVFNEIETPVPLDFLNFLSKSIDNVITIKNDKSEDIYKGGVFQKTLDFSTDIMKVVSYPFISQLDAIEDTYAQTDYVNPIKLLKDILDDNIPRYYTVNDFIGFKESLTGINAYIDTNSDTINIMNLLLQICNLFCVSLYLKRTEMNVFVIGNFPDDALDVSNYFITKPVLPELTGVYYDYLTFTYKNSTGGAEKTVTSGSGNIKKSIEQTADIFMDDTSAQNLADRLISIYSKNYYNFEVPAQAGFPSSVGEFVKYSTKYGDFIVLITSKEETPNQINLKGIGVLKNGA